MAFMNIHHNDWICKSIRKTLQKLNKSIEPNGKNYNIFYILKGYLLGDIDQFGSSYRTVI
jgi:hypothetical protein